MKKYLLILTLILATFSFSTQIYARSSIAIGTDYGDGANTSSEANNTFNYVMLWEWDIFL